MNSKIGLSNALPGSCRGFLEGTAIVNLTVDFQWGGTRHALVAALPDAGFAPNVFLQITPDDSVIVIAKRVEMGQDAHTGIATIVVEELDADWNKIRAKSAPADTKHYASLAFGTVQGTGGSSATANPWMQLREAGTKVYAMLVEAAAQQWQVPAIELRTHDDFVERPTSQREASYGSLAAMAVELPMSEEVQLKDLKDFRLTGYQAPRTNVPGETDGSAQLTLDVSLPGMLVVLLQRPPLFGATVRSFDAMATGAIPGVVKMVQTPHGTAAVIKGFWAAKQGHDALKVEQDGSKAEKHGPEALVTGYRKLAEQPGEPTRRDGDAAKAAARATRGITTSYELPFLVHAPMKSLDAVVRLTADSCEIWAGDQFQAVDQGNATHTAGLKSEQVEISMLYAGGSFDRHVNAWSDYIVEAVPIVKMLGANDVPVRLQWIREDDIHGGSYRLMYYHRLGAGLDADGELVGWQHRTIGQSILESTPFAAVMVKDDADATSVKDAANLPYTVPNVSVELSIIQAGVPVLRWWVVGSSHTVYAVETFIGGVAQTADKDPYLLHRDLLVEQPHLRGVLKLAAEKAGQDSSRPLPIGHGRGIAVAEAFKTFVAQVVEISVDKNGRLEVERVVRVVDCGIPTNLDAIATQMEGGIDFSLGAILRNAITLKDGRVEQNNLDSHQVPRTAKMPKVEMHIMLSGEASAGVDEPDVVPINPTLANAVFTATG